MAIIGQTNPWLAAAGSVDQGANQLAQTLMRLPLLRQQIQSGALEQQLMRGQLAFQPQLQQAQLGQYQARTGADKARAELYGAEGREHTAKAETAEGYNKGLNEIQGTLAKVMAGDQSPSTQAALVQGISKLDPKVMTKIVDSILQSKGAMNPQLMNSPQAQLASILGSKQTGQNIPANALNVPFGGGEPTPGLVRTGPGQQVTNPNTGAMLANNTNHSGAQSSGLAIAALRAAVADPNNVNPQQVIQAAQAYVNALQGGMTNAPAAPPTTNVPVQQGTNAAPVRKFTWTAQGLIPQQ